MLLPAESYWGENGPNFVKMSHFLAKFFGDDPRPMLDKPHVPSDQDGTFGESAICAWGVSLADLFDAISQMTLPHPEPHPSSSHERNGDKVEHCYGNVDITA